MKLRMFISSVQKEFVEECRPLWSVATHDDGFCLLAWRGDREGMKNAKDTNVV